MHARDFIPMPATQAGMPSGTGASLNLYPLNREGIPPLISDAGEYQVRFAQNAEDLDQVFKLRFEVYNLEMNEGLEASFLTGRDEDAFDAQCHHLLVIQKSNGRLVGTYRMQTLAMARRYLGFYSAGEFAIEDMPMDLLRDAVEVGRACIDRAHRNGRVLQLLWKGLANYLHHNRKRYLFGCCSLASQDPATGKALLEQLKAAGQLHPALWVAPRPGIACPAAEAGSDLPTVEIPRLLQGYLNLGGWVCSDPAIDRQFKTIDYLVLVDVEAMPKGLFQRFLGRREAVHG